MTKHECEPRPQNDRLLTIVVDGREAWAEYDTFYDTTLDFGIVFCPYCGARLAGAAASEEKSGKLADGLADRVSRETR